MFGGSSGVSNRDGYLGNGRSGGNKGNSNSSRNVFNYSLIDKIIGKKNEYNDWVWFIFYIYYYYIYILK